MGFPFCKLYILFHKNTIQHYTPHLNDAYTAFGKVIEGMDTVNRIAETKTDYSDRSLENQVMQNVTVETFSVKYPEPERC